MHQCCSHRGIYASAQRTNRPSAFRLLANRLDHRGDESCAIPILLCTAYLKNEIAQDFRAAFGVIYFRMEFEPVKSLSRVLHGADSIVGAPSYAKPLRQSNHMVAVAIPDLKLPGEVREKLGAVFDIELGGAILASLGSFHSSTKRMRQPMHAVANSEHWNIQLQYLRIADRRCRVVHGTGPAGQDDT